MLSRERTKEVKACIRCENKRPVFLMQGIPPLIRWAGLSLADFCRDPLTGFMAAIEVLRRAELEAGDIHGLNFAGCGTRPDLYLLKLYSARVLLPGRDLGENIIWQTREREVMAAGDYDFLLERGYPALFRKILPYITNVAEFDCLMAEMPQRQSTLGRALAGAGFVELASAFPVPQVPFEILSGMRMLKNLLHDCYRDPDKVKAASDRILEDQMKSTVMLFAQEEESSLGGWIGGWNGAPVILSPKLWSELIWPYLKKAGDFMLANHKVPVFHLDQCWDREIPRFADFPPGSVVLHTDGTTDLVNTRRILGDKVCLMGDVPAALLVCGTPAQVEAYVLRLIDSVGPAGLIVCPGCDAPHHTPYENFIAMAGAVNRWQ
ncbi:MAG: uroporphyrinogen decarboxylase family protein [Dehalobacterium sp.]